MARKLTTTLTCDRCKQDWAHDLVGHEPADIKPAGWTNIRLKSSDVLLCDTCEKDLVEWIDEGRK